MSNAEISLSLRSATCYYKYTAPIVWIEWLGLASRIAETTPVLGGASDPNA